jgi:hypothetical protein
MSGIDIGLKHQVAELRFRELLAAAEHQRAIDAALEARSPSCHSCIVEVRAVVASALLRAGSRLMPDEADSGHSSHGAFGLRPGQ